MRSEISGREPSEKVLVASLRTPAVVITFRTAVPCWGQTTQILSKLSSKRDCGPKRVNPFHTTLLGLQWSRFGDKLLGI